MFVHLLSFTCSFMSVTVILFFTGLLSFGVKESAWVNKIFTAVNVLVLIFVIISGFVKGDALNWNISEESLINVTIVRRWRISLSYSFSSFICWWIMRAWYVNYDLNHSIHFNLLTGISHTLLMSPAITGLGAFCLTALAGHLLVRPRAFTPLWDLTALQPQVLSHLCTVISRPPIWSWVPSVLVFVILTRWGGEESPEGHSHRYSCFPAGLLPCLLWSVSGPHPHDALLPAGWEESSTFGFWICGLGACEICSSGRIALCSLNQVNIFLCSHNAVLLAKTSHKTVYWDSMLILNIVNTCIKVHLFILSFVCHSVKHNTFLINFYEFFVGFVVVWLDALHP